MEIIKFAIIDADTSKHVVSVEAFSTTDAIERFGLIRTLVQHYKEPGSFWQVIEHDPEVHSTAPTFTESFFLVIEQLASSNALKH
jgi:hypothetical protein